MSYIKPNLRAFKSLDELLKSPPPSNYLSRENYIESLELTKSTFLVSEPGYGKTRFLKEIALREGANAFFIDLKLLGNAEIDSFIRRDGIFEIKPEAGFSEIQRKQVFKTPKFALENAVFCFDALDEVSQENFSKTVNAIKEFSEKHQITFIISCRKNYLQRWAHLLSEMELEYVELLQLSTKQVKEFFRLEGVNTADTEEILGKTYIRNRERIIQTPRYLELLIRIIREHGGIEIIKGMSRCDLFELFINGKLFDEDSKLEETNQPELIKKILEKLSLTMEIYQSNSLKKDDLMEFFDSIDSNLSISFMHQVPLKSLYERSILKDNITEIEFENTEFQEYLAAKEIFKLGRIDQAVFNLAFEESLHSVHPSWINTLSFLIEFESKILVQILEYIFSQRGSIPLQEHIKLIHRSAAEQLSVESRNKIFHLVFTHYQDHNHWIEYDFGEELSFFYTKENHDLLWKCTNPFSVKEERENIKIGNAIMIGGYALENGLLGEADKTILINISKKCLLKSQNPVVLRKALYALGVNAQINAIPSKAIDRLFMFGDDTVISSLIYALEKCNKNSKKAVKTFLKGLKSETFAAKHALYDVSNASAFTYMLRELSEHEDLQHEFIEHDHRNEDEINGLIERMRHKKSPQLINEAKNFLITVFKSTNRYTAERSHFVLKLAEFIRLTEPEFIFQLIKEVNNENSTFHMRSILIHFLTLSNIEKFLEIVEGKKEPKEFIGIQTLNLLKYKKLSGWEAIYEKGLEILGIKIEDINDEPVDTEPDDPSNQVYDDFKDILNNDESGGMYFFLNNYELLKEKVEYTEKNILEKVMKKEIFKKIKPHKYELHITERKTQGVSYTTARNVRLMDICIVAAAKLNLDISGCEQEILDFIPFTYTESSEAIHKLIPNPTEAQIDSFISKYEKRSDDIIEFHPFALIQFFKRYNSEKALLFLERYVHWSELSNYDRSEALIAIGNLNVTNQHLNKIFKKYNGTEQQFLANIANRIQIEKHKNKKAILWRFKQLNERVAPFIRPQGSHGVSNIEEELDQKKFATCLIQLKDLAYEEEVLNLLNDSLTIYEKGKEFHAYAEYLWQIVFDFYSNLKEYRSYAILNKLEKRILEIKNKIGGNWLEIYFQRLKKEFVTYLGKPKDYSECIKIYNELKAQKFLDIFTSRDLFEVVKEVVEIDLKNWVENEGAYKVLTEIPKQRGKRRQLETLIQRTIKSQFENCMQKRGLRQHDINVFRESELLDGVKTDFIITYGLIGPILIEIKLSNNQEVSSIKEIDKYKPKLEQYMNGTKSDFGIFLIFQVDDTKKHALEKVKPRLEKAYKNNYNISILGLNCVK